MIPLKIRLRLVAPGSLALTVLQQDESTRGVKIMCFMHDGMRLASSEYPAIGYSTLWVRGYSRGNDLIESEPAVFATFADRAEYVAKCRELVASYNASIGHPEEPGVEVVSEDGTPLAAAPALCARLKESTPWTPTLSQIAADVRRLAPDVLRHSVSACTRTEDFHRDHDEDYLSFRADAGADAALKDRLALVGSMVLACRVRRTLYGWETACPVIDDYGRMAYRHCYFPDYAHGGDWLLSLHAAFLAAKEATDA